MDSLFQGNDKKIQNFIDLIAVWYKDTKQLNPIFRIIEILTLVVLPLLLLYLRSNWPKRKLILT